MEKDGFLDTNIHASAPSMITIGQVTWQKIAIIVDLDWVSDLIIWNWKMITFQLLITVFIAISLLTNLKKTYYLRKNLFFLFFPQISKYKTN